MEKPTIFFSHSSRDKQSLGLLKELFVKKTSNSIDVFLSSDGQSIKVGTNWVHRIEEGLKRSSMMVIFITPASIKSDWIYFEAGYSYARDKQVIPIGFLGVDIGTTPPPLSLLQGFNVTSEDGLNNLIVVANKAFDLKHEPTFNAEEYKKIVAQSGIRSQDDFGEHTPTLQEIVIKLANDSDLSVDDATARIRLVEILEEKGIDYHTRDQVVDFYGVGVSIRHQQPRIRVRIDPLMFSEAAPTLEQWLTLITKSSMDGISMTATFEDFVGVQDNTHKQSARIFGTGASLKRSGGFSLDHLEFRVNRSSYFGKQGFQVGEAYLDVLSRDGRVHVDEFRQLITLLFETQILYLEKPNY